MARGLYGKLSLDARRSHVQRRREVNDLNDYEEPLSLRGHSRVGGSPGRLLGFRSFLTLQLFAEFFDRHFELLSESAAQT